MPASTRKYGPKPAWLPDWTCDPIHSQPIGMPSQRAMLKKAISAIRPAFATGWSDEPVIARRGYLAANPGGAQARPAA